MRNIEKFAIAWAMLGLVTLSTGKVINNERIEHLGDIMAGVGAGYFIGYRRREKQLNEELKNINYLPNKYIQR